MYDGLFLICDTDDFTFSQASNLVRSVWRELQSSWFEIVRYIMVSSAKSLMILLIVSGISLMYIRKMQGPRTEPCGTPDRTGHESECSPSRTTLWVRFDRNDWIQLMTWLLMPSRWSFSKSL